MLSGAFRRRQSAVLGMLLFCVSLLYLRLWILDYSFSAQDRESLRKEFHRASTEAIDESAQWRRKYDGEAQRARQSAARLLQANEDLANATRTLAMLQQENESLRAQVSSLNLTVETMRRRGCDPIAAAKHS
ncbi:acyl-CoA-binding domain protein [Wolffia australiana]